MPMSRYRTLGFVKPDLEEVAVVWHQPQVMAYLVPTEMGGGRVTFEQLDEVPRFIKIWVGKVHLSDHAALAMLFCFHY